MELRLRGLGLITVVKKRLQKECNKENLGVIFEFTAPGTPQPNSVAERRIPMLWVEQEPC